MNFLTEFNLCRNRTHTYLFRKMAIMTRMEKKITGTEMTHISLASQMVYPPASRPVTKSGADNISDKAKLKTNTRGNQ